MRISFITYTYNDHAFVHELIAYSKGFKLPMHEIIVADDCSAQPYTPVGDEKVLRQTQNLGPAQNKRAALDMASGDVLLSIDADVRPALAWPRHALLYLQDPQVGLVGASVRPALADNYLSRALHHLAEPHNSDRQVEFLPGAVWLLRREVWQKTGGLAQYAGRTHEDYWFARQVRSAGFKLIAADKFPVYEKRRLHRLDYCRQQIYYMHAPFTAILHNKGPAEIFAQLEKELAEAVAYAQKSAEYAIVYIKLLYCSALLQGLTTPPATANAAHRFDPSGTTAHMLNLLRDYPELSALLQEDWRQLNPAKGAAPLTPLCATADNCPTDSWLAGLLAPLLPGGRSSQALQELEKNWVQKLRQEDAQGNFNGHYLHTSQ